MSYDDLKGKRVLVTGSSSGIGAETAVQFARQGCTVGVHYFQTEEGGRRTLQQVEESGRGFLLSADMRDKAQVTAMIDTFTAQAGGLDILINNAGTLLGRVDIETMSVSHFDDEFATNARSTFLAAQAALACLKESRGCIVNVGSIAGHTGGGGGSGIYASAKAAVHTMTIAMAKEFAPYGIRVNCVLPGLIETRFHEKFSTPERRQNVAQQTPLGRNGTADDVARAIMFLSSQQAAFITGESLAVNGGLEMRI